MAIAALVLGTRLAYAQNETGNEIYAWCQNPNYRGAVVGFTAGLIDGFGVGTEMGAAKQYCFPNGVTLGQATDLVCKTLHDDPANRNYPAAYQVIYAFSKAWPCPK